MKSTEFDIIELKKLPRNVFIVSDLIAYCINIPVSIIIVFIVLNVSGTKIILFSAVMLAVVCAAGTLTVFQLRTFFVPVMEYFRKLSAGEKVSDEEYFNAKIRFYSTPIKRAVSGMIAWIVLMPAVIIIFVFVFSPSFSAKTIIFSVLAVDIISIGSLYYIGIDWLIRRTAHCGVFSRKAVGEDKIPMVRSSTVLSVSIIGFVAILCALMIPIANGLFYRSAYKFFTLQMQENALSVQTSVTGLAERYIILTRNLAVNRAAEDAFKGNTSGMNALAKKTADAAGPDLDSIILFKYNNELKTIYSYGGDVSNDRLASLNLLRSVDIPDLTGDIAVSAVISPVSGKPVLSFVKRNTSGVTMICVNMDSFAAKELNRMRTGRSGYCMIIDRFNIAAVHNDSSKLMRDLGNDEFKDFLSRKDVFESLVNVGDQSLVCFESPRDIYGIRTISVVNDSEIESFGMRPVLFMCIFIIAGLAVIGYGIYRILRVRLEPLEDCRMVISAMGNGDLSVNAVSYSRDDIGQILTILLEFTDKLRSIMHNIQTVANELADASGDMSLTSVSVAENAQGQAASVEEVTATSEEITAGMQNITKGTDSQFASLEKLLEQIGKLANLINGSSADVNNANNISRDISLKATEGSRSLGAMNESISRIAARSSEMINIVGIINDISDRINLLSLNAAIEAARAGDSGRGFAVVADEISKLADQTAVSIKEIDRLIQDTNGEIEGGLSTIENTTKSIGSIIDGVGSINTMMDTVAGSMNLQREVKGIVESEATDVKKRSEEMRVAAEEQERAMDEVMKSITSINELTQENASGSNEMTEHSQKVKQLAEALKSDIGFFKL